ncbi:MAG: hypothetical protein U0L22_04570, partial [Bacteroidales bacterium]|nr:hypothetical protein [Bacteroidales bacterium]
FKVYLTSKTGKVSKRIAKDKTEVMEILKKAKKEGFLSYTVSKRIKPSTDVPVARGDFSKECKVVYVDGLDTDWRVVGANVVNWDKYKKAKEDEER